MSLSEMRVVSVDPGKNCCGLALFERGTLVDVALSKLPDGFYRTGQVAAFHAQAVRPWGRVDRVVCEEMKISAVRDGRNASRIIAVANDLLVLTSVGGYVAGTLGGELVYVPPAKHGKDITKNRVLATLAPVELAIVETACTKQKASLHHNLYDGVLIGLRAVGRYG